MRIAMFTDSFYPELGGIQDSILANIRELGARGHRIMLFAPAAARRDFQRLGLEPHEPEVGSNVAIRRLPSLPLPSSSQQSRLVIPTGRAARALKAFRPDLIHVHTFFGAGLEALHAARRLHVPLVGTNHWYAQGFDLYAPIGRKTFRQFCGHALARFYNHCDWVTAPSRFTLDDLHAHGMNRRARVISNPINTYQFRPATATERQQLKGRLRLGDSVVVYAGRLAREKRIDVILHAIAVARARVPDISLVIAGHGSDRTRLE
ncbi:MAG: glycosyltransferase, partial [Gammaproteobacteria bacterium]